MRLDPRSLAHDLDLLEEVEKATLRMVTRAIVDFSSESRTIFANEPDKVQDIAEDVTREALDRMSTSIIPVRLFSKLDYKRARFVFFPDFELPQALYVDSKAEAVEGQRTVTIQMGQTSMTVHQVRGGAAVSVPGTMPKVLTTPDYDMLTTTVFVKYNYRSAEEQNDLVSISVTALPNGFLQQVYNPDPQHTIWLAGRDAPTLGEQFRVRISLRRLKQLRNWRVQYIQVSPPEPFEWDD